METTLTVDGSEISTVGDFAVLDVIRPALPSPRDLRLDVPGRAGSYLYVEEPGDREIVARVAYVGDDFADRRAKVQALAVWLYSETVSKIIVGDEPDRYWRGRIAAAPTPREIQTLAEFELRWLVDPFAYDLAVDTVTKSQTVSGAFGPAPFTGGGDVKTPPSIEVTAGGAGMTNGFSATVNGQTLVYGDTLAPFESVTLSSVSSLVLSTIGFDVELTGAFNPGDVDMRDVSGDFGQIVPGTNTITITPADSSNGASVSIDYRKRYLA